VSKKKWSRISLITTFLIKNFEKNVPLRMFIKGLPLERGGSIDYKNEGTTFEVVTTLWQSQNKEGEFCSLNAPVAYSSINFCTKS